MCMCGLVFLLLLPAQGCNIVTLPAAWHQVTLTLLHIEQILPSEVSEISGCETRNEYLWAASSLLKPKRRREFSPPKRPRKSFWRSQKSLTVNLNERMRFTDTLLFTNPSKWAMSQEQPHSRMWPQQPVNGETWGVKILWVKVEPPTWLLMGRD